MANVSSIQPSFVPAATQRTSPLSRRPGDDASSPITRENDRADFSPQARAAGAESDKSIRNDLVSRVRDEIARGTYVTDAKLDEAAAGVARDLGLQA